jgi:hypothetical protein
MSPIKKDDLEEKLKDLEGRWDKLREESPNIPHQIWRRIEQTMTAEKEKENFELELLHDNLSLTSPAK